jgi:hypothetical protein
MTAAVDTMYAMGWIECEASGERLVDSGFQRLSDADQAI